MEKEKVSGYVRMRAVIIDIDGICFDPTERLKRCKKDEVKPMSSVHSKC